LNTLRLAAILGVGLLCAPAYAAQPDQSHDSAPGTSEQRRILYYQAPMGAERSPVPKKDEMGMDYLPVYEEPARPPPAPSRRILFYRAPMSADTSPVPKKDQMGMDYVPVYEDDGGADGTVTVSAERVQVLGVRTEAARRARLATPIRAVGTIAADERRLAVVAPRFEGWIQELIANTTGQPVRRGEPLFTFYSPEAAAAEREYLVARQISGAVAQAATAKLHNLGLAADRIAQLGRGGKAADVLTYLAPLDGVVMEKAAIAGQRFAAGDALYRIADLSTVWVLADVFEQDLAGVRTGEPAAVRLTAYPGQSFAGSVSFIYPTLNPSTRTAKVRVELANPGGLLKPDMYATVVIDAGLGGEDVLTVPESALLDDGTRQIVLVERSPGRYQPKVVTTGRRGNGDVEITSGIADAEKVVVAANFLIDSESNLRAALRSFTAPEPAAGAAKPP
jgi:membrane fusion protein, copper/silver efflux system